MVVGVRRSYRSDIDLRNENLELINEIQAILSLLCFQCNDDRAGREVKPGSERPARNWKARPASPQKARKGLGEDWWRVSSHQWKPGVGWDPKG
ncbi:hypothetical protein NDU88_002460 [Pleurodeles waltl]|uniref:Uncharacterized protein n=1 Tax=Pleurodeles waltl TaxID=8319 RepID=A0AAV7P6T6_PLEWA|nr:hypothetical protein NDU88_002460 [Pleurodeles waltl]